MRPLTSFATGVLLAVAIAAPVGAAGAGPPHDAFLVDGVLYRTVGTPNDLSGTGAPAATYDALYAFGGVQTDIAAAAPGDVDYNGGRWMRFQVTWNVTPYPLESEEDILDAAAIGDVTIASEPDAQFVCPVIKAG